MTMENPQHNSIGSDDAPYILEAKLQRLLEHTFGRTKAFGETHNFILRVRLASLVRDDGCTTDFKSM